MKGALIANGRTAEIFAWGQDETAVLKLFRPEFNADTANYEVRVARAVSAASGGAGAPTFSAPAVLDVVQVEGRTGIIYERAHGLTLYAWWLQRPFRRLFSAAHHMAEIHAAMHSAPLAGAGDLPRQRERLAKKIHRAALLSDTLKARAAAALNNLPEGAALCHGDFHPLNIILSTSPPTGGKVIDWMDAAVGNPLADVGRSVLLISMFIQSAQNRGVFKRMVLNTFLSTYLRRYCALTNARREDIMAWLPVLAAARLDEDITEEEAALVQIVRHAFG